MDMVWQNVIYTGEVTEDESILVVLERNFAIVVRVKAGADPKVLRVNVRVNSDVVNAALEFAVDTVLQERERRSAARRRARQDRQKPPTAAEVEAQAREERDAEASMAEELAGDGGDDQEDDDEEDA